MKLTRRLVMSALTGIAIGVALYFPDRDDGSGAVLGGVFAFAACAVGLAAVDQVRPLPPRSAVDRLRLMGLSLALGCALGVGNLIANYTIASLDPEIHRQMIDQWTRFHAWSAIVSGPMVEELGFRLMLMGGTAWVLAHLTDDRRVVFVGALGVSSLLFGVAHVLPGSRPTTGVVHATGIALKSAAAGVALGWVFWRRGLPYSMACHGLANAVHLLVWPSIFRP